MNKTCPICAALFEACLRQRHARTIPNGIKIPDSPFTVRKTIPIKVVFNYVSISNTAVKIVETKVSSNLRIPKKFFGINTELAAKNILSF